MKVEIGDGDEKPRQYLLLASETPQEEEFLVNLRSWWREQDY